jgi:hypothetical protein
MFLRELPHADHNAMRSRAYTDMGLLFPVDDPSLHPQILSNLIPFIFLRIVQRRFFFQINRVKIRPTFHQDLDNLKAATPRSQMQRRPLMPILHAIDIRAESDQKADHRQRRVIGSVLGGMDDRDEGVLAGRVGVQPALKKVAEHLFVAQVERR